MRSLAWMLAPSLRLPYASTSMLAEAALAQPVQASQRHHRSRGVPSGPQDAGIESMENEGAYRAVLYSCVLAHWVALLDRRLRRGHLLH